MMRGTLDMTNLSRKQSNLSEMHAGIRNATALLQQEVGQAGRLAFPAPVTVAAPIPLGDQWVTVTTSSAPSMFVNEKLEILGSNASGDVEEIVTVTEINGNSFRAVFATSYFAGARVMPAGGFAEGVIPTTRVNGSTDSKLKIVGDINGDGTIMYVEYTCDWNSFRLYRNMMPYDTKPADKPPLSVEHVLLDNLDWNPPDPGGIDPRPCFTYDQRTIYGNTYVINVAIMTTVRTDERDQTTGRFQKVTKALLNVAPRNVFNVWQVASLNYRSRIEPLPKSVLDLLVLP
jgi:hypothetical protein